MNNFMPKVHITAEIGTSHGGNINKAKELIQAAAAAGADSVKLQWVYADEILHPNTGYVLLPGGNIRLYDSFKQLEMPPDFFQEIADYAHSLGCNFVCSPFGKKSLHELWQRKPDTVKIASPELNHYPLLTELAKLTEQNKEQKLSPPSVVISSGVSTLGDIEKALLILKPSCKDLTLLHCITAYPAPPEQYNLSVLKNLSGIFGIPVGISDHSMNEELVPVLSVACEGKYIEKHITLSRNTAGLDDPVALEPNDFKNMVNAVREAEKIINEQGATLGKEIIIKNLSKKFGENLILQTLGTGIKQLAPAEKENYGRTNRSIHVNNTMKAGEIITKDSVSILRTEKILNPGLSPEHLNDIIGKKLLKDIDSGQGITWQHLLTQG